MRIQFQKMCREARAEKDPRVLAAKNLGLWVVDAFSFSNEFISPGASREEIAAKAEATLADFREKLALGQDDWHVLLHRNVYSQEGDDDVEIEVKELPVPLAYADAMVAALRRALDVDLGPLVAN